MSFFSERVSSDLVLWVRHVIWDASKQSYLADLACFSGVCVSSVWSIFRKWLSICLVKTQERKLIFVINKKMFTLKRHCQGVTATTCHWQARVLDKHEWRMMTFWVKVTVLLSCLCICTQSHSCLWLFWVCSARRSYIDFVLLSVVSSSLEILLITSVVNIFQQQNTVYLIRDTLRVGV